MRNIVFGFMVTVIVFILLVGCSNPKEVEPKPPTRPTSISYPKLTKQ